MSIVVKEGWRVREKYWEKGRHRDETGDITWKQESRRDKAGEKTRKVEGSVLKFNDYIM